MSPSFSRSSIAVALALTVALSVSVASVSASGDVVLPPLKKPSNKALAAHHAAVVFVPGAGVDPSQYKAFAETVQAEFHDASYSVWVGVPNLPFNVPEPFMIGNAVERVLSTMKKQFNMPADTRVVFGGHGLGGIVLVDYVASLQKKKPAGVTVPNSMFLVGSFITRKYYSTGLAVPTLTIGGSLDGLSRVTRVMEAHRMLSASFHPVAVVRGMNHFGIATGQAPFLMKERDLRSEMSSVEARSTVAGLVTSFVQQKLEAMKQVPAKLGKALADTDVFVAPLESAYELEGFPIFKTHCNDNAVTAECQVGAPWTEYAQKLMTGLDGKVKSLVVTDRFRPMPMSFLSHFAKVDNKCPASTVASQCSLKIETVSATSYNMIDMLDTGFVPTSANEISAKLVSRQAAMQAAGFPAKDFNKTDGASLCQEINQQAYDLALHMADKATRERFLEMGQKMKMGSDQMFSAAPLWVMSGIDYKDTTDENGYPILLVTAPAVKTSTDFIIPTLAGGHYCKLLSVGRAMEWIYVDGLRKMQTHATAPQVSVQ